MNAFVIDTIAALLTIMALTRIAGDNPLFRVAQYMFVGASLGLAVVVAFHQTLRPAALDASNGSLLVIPALVLGLLLLPRALGNQSLSWLANMPLALIFGVGAALAVGGAIIGTLTPQILDTARPITSDPLQLVGALTLALGTIITLATFYYTVPRETPRGRVLGGVMTIGHWLLMVTFGVLFAGSVQSYTGALIERIDFLTGWLSRLAGQ